jgi:drug/metabolite transporter superfamily protein YnfA
MSFSLARDLLIYAFAAFGGVYILASLAWLRIVEGVKLTAYDVAGGRLGR